MINQLPAVSDPQTTKRPVVAAAILNSISKPTHLLCATRAYPPELRGQIEFPGGKTEPDETWQQALSREVFEELGCELIFGQQLCLPTTEPWKLSNGRIMRVWLSQVSVTSPPPKSGNSHSQIEWVPFSKISDLPWLESNRPIVQYLLAQFSH